MGAAVTIAAVWAIAILVPAPAAAADVGQISVIEDTSGKILPALGFCSYMMYPNSLCTPWGGQAFYETHTDEFDMLVFFTNKNTAATEKAGYPLQADVRGIGQDTVPWSYTHFGSGGRLLQALDLGAVQTMPDDPEGIFSSIPISGLEVIGHEIGHHWMAYASIDLGDGRGDLDILRGYFESGAITHYSCWFNSDSIMYGGMLTDNGDGTFTDVNGPRKYSQLDQYMMGLRSAAEVDPMWYVEVGGSLHGCADWPQARGVAHDISGVRYDIGMDDVTRALGERDPATSRCHYKVAFVFVHRVGEPPSTADLEKVERYRVALEPWYAWATDGRGSLDTRLDGCGTGTPGCPGAVSPHCGTPPPDEDPWEPAPDASTDTVVDPPVDVPADDLDTIGADADATIDDTITDTPAGDTGIVGPGEDVGCGCGIVG